MTTTETATLPPVPPWLNLLAAVSEEQVAAIVRTVEELEALIPAVVEALRRAGAMMDTVEDQVSRLVESEDDVWDEAADGIHQGFWIASGCQRLQDCFQALYEAMDGRI